MDLPSWTKYTASGLLGCIVTVVTMTLSWSDVRHTAESAESGVEANAQALREDIRPRLRTLERESAAHHQLLVGIKQNVSQVLIELRELRKAK